MTDSFPKETTLIIRIQVVALVLALLPGCSTIMSRQNPDSEPRVYGGTVGNITLSTYHSIGIVFTLVDLPFSLIADTLLLPITIPEQIHLNRKKRFLAANATVNIEQIRDMLKERPELVHEINRRTSLLCYAAANGRADIVALLLEYGADPNSADDHRNTPLHCAVIRWGHLPGGVTFKVASEAEYSAVVQVLMKNGADANDPWYFSPLRQAVVNGKIELLRVMVENGADLEDKNESNETLLHSAALRGHVEVARFLIDHGAEINARANNGATPLDIALDGKIALLRVMVEYGADLKQRDKYNRTMLHRAAYGGNVEVAQFLIDHGVDVNARDNKGATPLEIALNGKFEFLRVMVENGADLKQRDKYIRTILHMAAYSGQVETVQFLIDHGADINARDNKGATPLEIALNGEVALLRVMVENGADLKQRDKYNRTILHTAAYSGQVEAVQSLIDHGANVNARDNKGATPLEIALRRKHPRVAELLLGYITQRFLAASAEGDLKQVRDLLEGRPELAQEFFSYAVTTGRADFVALLLEYGADPNSTDDYGRPPLYLAVSRSRNWPGDVEFQEASEAEYSAVVQVLMKNGADANAPRYFSPLRQAVVNGKIELLRVMVKNGADLEDKNEYNETLLHSAALRGQVEAAQFLIDHGADVNARDQDGDKPIQSALKNKHPRVAELLRAHGGGE